MSLGIKSSAFLRMEDPSWIQEPIVNPGTHRESRNPDTTHFLGKGWNRYTPSRTRFSIGLAYNRSKVSVKNLKSGLGWLVFWDLSSHICQIFMRMARWGDLHFRKISDFWPGSEILFANKYEIWSEMGPYGSVGAHIKTGRSPYGSG